MLAGFAWGKGGEVVVDLVHLREGVVWFSVCGAPLGDFADGGSVDVLVISVVSLRMVSIVLVL